MNNLNKKMRRYHFKSKIIALCLALALSATAHAEGYTLLPSGAHFQVGEGLMRVEFVTPDIVRVRYTLEPDFLGNGTIIHETRLTYTLRELRRISRRLADIALEAGIRNEYRSDPDPGYCSTDTSWYIRLKKTW